MCLRADRICATQERDAHCQQLICEHHKWVCQVLQHEHPTPCVFSDVLDLTPRDCFAEKSTFQQKKHAIYSSPTRLWHPCTVHCKECMVPFVDYDHSGLPCTDNSRANHNWKLEEGSTNVLFIVWALRLRRFATKIAILENTPDTLLCSGLQSRRNVLH